MNKIEDMPKIELGISNWTTADGEEIEYKDLTDDHLKNIIKDGYRNNHIYIEAKNRKFNIPDRPVDKLYFSELMSWVESFASCAIEGNVFGTRMMKLWNSSNKSLFLLELNIFLERTDVSERINNFMVNIENNP